MAISCAGCGTANPDGNAFCQNCGAALAAAPAAPQAPTPAPVAPGAPLPPAVPQASAHPLPTPVAPAYTPVPSQPPVAAAPPAATTAGPGAVHRLSRNALFAIIGAAVLVIAGVGAVIALASKPTPHVPVTPHLPAPAVSGPATTAPPTSRPSAAPSSAPTTAPRPSNGGTSAGFATIPPLPGFTQSDTSSTSVELDANDHSGSVFVELLPSDATSNQDLANLLLSSAQQSSPDATQCKDASTGDLSGAGGQPIHAITFFLCKTVTPQNGSAFAAKVFYAAGLARDGSGNEVAAILKLFAPADSYDALAQQVPDSFFNDLQFNATAP